MMRRRLLILAVPTALTLLLLAPPCGTEEPGDRRWGPFRGRIIDADTGQPIPGAIALVIWLEMISTPVQTNQKYYDALVAVAGANGHFEIPRRTPPFFSTRFSEPVMEYLAPGFAMITATTSPEGLEIVRMRRLAALSPDEQFRHRVALGKAMLIPTARRDELLDIVNAERRQMGLPPVGSLFGVP
jgi:hypothetical protein